MSIRVPRRLAIPAAFALAVALGAAGDARADGAGDYPPCTKKASPSDLDAAKGAHKAATEFNDRGEYDKAIQYWRDAYGFDCSAHGLLINIANAYEKKGDRAAAIATLEVYQSRTGGGDARIGEKLANLKAAAATAPPPTATTAPPPPPPSATAAPPPPPPATHTGRPYGLAPWFVAGGGAAVLVVGAILLPVGYGAISSAQSSCDANNVCPAGTDFASKGNAGRTETTIGWITLSVGAAALGGGLAWQLVGNKPQELPGAAKLHVLPLITPTTRGMVVGASF